jgi:hypothetical protein
MLYDLEQLVFIELPAEHVGNVRRPIVGGEEDIVSLLALAYEGRRAWALPLVPQDIAACVEAIHEAVNRQSTQKTMGARAFIMLIVIGKCPGWQCCSPGPRLGGRGPVAPRSKSRLPRFGKSLNFGN